MTTVDSASYISEDDSKSVPLGVSAKDLQCPICVETIQDAFVTSCGHTFCHSCLCTHLRNKRSCPSCSTYITQDNIYPNFLLNKILQKAAKADTQPPASLADAVLRVLNGDSSKLRLPDLDSVIEVLRDRREDISLQQQTSKLLLLLAFLKHAKKHKEGQLKELSSQLKVLHQDIGKLQQQQGQQGQGPAAAMHAPPAGGSSGPSASRQLPPSQQQQGWAQPIGNGSTGSGKGSHPLHRHVPTHGMRQQQQQQGTGRLSPMPAGLPGAGNIIIMSPEAGMPAAASVAAAAAASGSRGNVHVHHISQGALNTITISRQHVNGGSSAAAAMAPGMQARQQQGLGQGQQQDQQQQQQQHQELSNTLHQALLQGLHNPTATRSGKTQTTIEDISDLQAASVQTGQNHRTHIGGGGNSNGTAQASSRHLQPGSGAPPALGSGRHISGAGAGAQAAAEPGGSCTEVAQVDLGTSRQAHEGGQQLGNGRQQTGRAEAGMKATAGRELLLRLAAAPGAAAAAAAAAAGARGPGSGAAAAAAAAAATALTNGDAGLSEAHLAKKRRIMNQFEELEGAYFQMRRQNSQHQLAQEHEQHEADTQQQQMAIDGQSPGEQEKEEGTALDLFSQVLSTATQYNRMSVLAEVYRPSHQQQQPHQQRQAQATCNGIISSIEFDMEDRMFAAAGVSARIAVYDYNAVVAAAQAGAPAAQRGPAVEICTRSKLTCLSYNAAVKQHLIAGDYNGVVTLWDTATQQSVIDLDGHDRRIWSVDFCSCPAGDPSTFVSGSDDCTVKVWSTRDDNSIAVLQVKTNVCSVKYNPWDQHQVAVGSAGHNMLLYDLRSTRQPLATFSGHNKAVSYVRFISRTEIMTASTDSTLRLWDSSLAGGCCSAAASAIAAPDSCVRTFSGHANERNFVGLSVDGQFIACGSETNQVYIYYKAINTPSITFNLSQLDAPPAAGSSQAGRSFISALCWRRSSHTLLAANNQGRMWVLGMEP